MRLFCNEKEFPLKIKESRSEKGATSSTLSRLRVQHSRDPKEDFPGELSRGVPTVPKHLLSGVVGEAEAKAEVPKGTKAA